MFIIALMGIGCIFIIISAIYNRVEVGPIFAVVGKSGEITVTVLFIGLIAGITFLLLKSIRNSKHLTINENGIHFDSDFIKWPMVDKVAVYRANFPVIIIKSNHGKYKKLIGIFPFILSKKRIEELSFLLMKKGVRYKRWLI